jgi:hypothetical protein
MWDLFVAGSEIPGLLDKSLNGDIVEESFTILDKPCSGNLGDAESETQLVLEIGQLCMEADKLLPNNIILFFNSLKLFNDWLLAIEGRPQREFATVFANSAFKGVGVLHCFLDFHLNLSLVTWEVLLEQEALKLSEDALSTVGRSPTASFLHPSIGLLQDIKADISSEDIGMRDVVEDANGGRVVGVALWELEFEMEDSAFIESLLWSSDVGVPCEKVIFKWTGSHTHSRDFLILDLLKVFNETLMWKSLKFFIEGSPYKGLVKMSASFFHW